MEKYVFLFTLFILTGLEQAISTEDIEEARFDKVKTIIIENHVQNINNSSSEEVIESSVSIIFDRLIKGCCSLYDLESLNVNTLLSNFNDYQNMSDARLCVAICSDIYTKEFSNSKLLVELLKKREPLGYMNLLGLCHERGYGGCSEDVKFAVSLWEKAAEEGVWNAYGNLAFYYNIHNNEEKSFNLYKRAAEEGNIWAQYELAEYEFQRGKISYPQAVRVYFKCAQEGWRSAKIKLQRTFIVRENASFKGLLPTTERYNLKGIYCSLVEDFKPMFEALADYNNTGFDIPYNGILKIQSKTIINLIDCCLTPYLYLIRSLIYAPQNFCTCLQPRLIQDDRTDELFFDNKWMSVKPYLFDCLKDDKGIYPLESCLEDLIDSHTKTIEKIEELSTQSPEKIQGFIEGMKEALGSYPPLSSDLYPHYLFSFLKNYGEKVDTQKMCHDIQWMHTKRQKFKGYQEKLKGVKQMIKKYLETTEGWHNAFFLRHNPWWDVSQIGPLQPQE